MGSSLAPLLLQTDEFQPKSSAPEKFVGRSGAPLVEIVTRLTRSEECHVPNLRVVVPGRLCLYARPPQGSDLGFQGAGLCPLGIHGAVPTWSCLTWARQVWLLKPRALLERTIPELGGGGKGTTRNSRAYNSVTQVSPARCQHCALFHSCPPAVLTLQESWNPSRSLRAQLPAPDLVAAWSPSHGRGGSASTWRGSLFVFLPLPHFRRPYPGDKVVTLFCMN